MKIGIGLPNAVEHAGGDDMREWSRRADEAGFSTLAGIDRLVSPNHEPMTALAFAAGVTQRIALMTAIVIAPLRTNTALLAKEAATIDVLSGGHFTLGLAPGGRADDYEVAGVDVKRRGAIFDRQLEELRLHFAGESVGDAGGVVPEPRPGRPPILMGGIPPRLPPGRAARRLDHGRGPARDVRRGDREARPGVGGGRPPKASPAASNSRCTTRSVPRAPTTPRRTSAPAGLRK